MSDLHAAGSPSGNEQVQAAQSGHLTAGRGQIWWCLLAFRQISTDNSNYLGESAVHCCMVWCCWLSPLTGLRPLPELPCCSCQGHLISQQSFAGAALKLRGHLSAQQSALVPVQPGDDSLIS